LWLSMAQPLRYVNTKQIEQKEAVDELDKKVSAFQNGIEDGNVSLHAGFFEFNLYADKQRVASVGDISDSLYEGDPPVVDEDGKSNGGLIDFAGDLLDIVAEELKSEAQNLSENIRDAKQKTDNPELKDALANLGNRVDGIGRTASDISYSDKENCAPKLAKDLAKIEGIKLTEEEKKRCAISRQSKDREDRDDWDDRER